MQLRHNVVATCEGYQGSNTGTAGSLMPGSKAGDEDADALETPQQDDSTPSVLQKLQVCSSFPVGVCDSVLQQSHCPYSNSP